MITALEAFERSQANDVHTIQRFLDICELAVSRSAEGGHYSCNVNVEIFKHSNLSSAYVDLKKAGFETTFETDAQRGICTQITLSWDKPDFEKILKSCIHIV